MTKKKKILIAAVCFAAILIITLVAIASCKGNGKEPGGDTTAATGTAAFPESSGATPGTAAFPESSGATPGTAAFPESSGATPGTSATPETSAETPETSAETPETSAETPETTTGNEPVHYHSFGAWSVTRPATCGASGEETRRCATCGKQETRSTAQLTHSFGAWSVTRPATCGAAGEETRSCTNCGKQETRSTAQLAHSFGAWAVTRPATCGAAGEEARTCATCGAKETRSTAQLTHSYGGWATTRPATCGAAGEEARSCTNCGAKETRSTAQLTHSYGAWATTRPATCGAAGEEARSCTNCGKQETRNTAQLTHSFGGWTVTRTATCSTAGEEARTCAYCGAKETRSTALTGHVFSVTKNVDNDPFSDTFGSNGIETCPGCGATREIPYSDPDYRTDEFLRLLEQRVLYWINQYRAEEGVAPAQMLPRMWEYAQVRAPYLINNFAHDPKDEVAAATQIKYGIFTPGGQEITRYDWETDEIIHTGEYTKPQYSPNCGEAIGNAYWIGISINDFARSFATACRNSQAHWNYVGIRNYETAGVARSGRTFYLVICTRDEIKFED